LNLTLMPDYRTLFTFHPDDYDEITDIGPNLGKEVGVGDLPDGLGYLGLDGDQNSGDREYSRELAKLFQRTRW